MDRPSDRSWPRARLLPGLVLLLPAVGPAVFAQQSAGAKRLTFEQTLAGPERISFGGSPPSATFSRDGRHVELQKDGKLLWLDPRTLATREPEPVDPAAATESAAREAAVVMAFSRLPGFDEAAAKRVAGGRRFASADRNALLFDADQDLWFFRHGGERATRLTDSELAEENVRLAPDGRFASFVRGNDLFVIETDSSRERRITKDGSADRLNGKLDWVYQEEIYGRGNFQATWWSPTSRHLAFLALDESGVPHHPIVDHLPNRAELEDTRYPKAGDPNPTVRLGVARARDGRVTWIDLAAWAQAEPLIVQVGWTPDGKQLCFQVQDREQTWLDLALADPESGAPTVLLRETTGSFVERADEPRWLADGSFLWRSERTGFKHLERRAGDGKLQTTITGGEWEVREITAVDEAAQLIWFSGSRDSAIAPNLYRIGFDGNNLVRLTQGPGSHSVEWSPDKAWFLDRVSSVAFPPEVRLCAGADGRVLQVLGKAEVKTLDEYAFTSPELLQIPTRDGFRMDATLLKPSPFDPTRKYPVWLPTYSGPDAPSVGDRWNGDAWPQFLAQQGYVVLQVNNRTSSQRGHLHVAKCWQQLGVQELADLEDAIAWLGVNRAFVDPTRVGITGWSYGGFMTAFALTHSRAFKLGVAGAGVYDWRLYDTIYTERFMRTPQNNPAGYAATSCIEAAKNLSGYLVLAHGTLDDNVHFQNTIQMAYALQQAGIDRFEVMPYAKSRHGLGGPELNNHFRRVTWKAIRERL